MESTLQFKNFQNIVNHEHVSDKLEKANLNVNMSCKIDQFFVYNEKYTVFVEETENYLIKVDVSLQTYEGRNGSKYEW